MPARFMLDTDVCIYFQTGAHPRIVERFLSLRSGEAVISVVTYGELHLGAAKSVQKARALAAITKVTSFAPVERLSAEAAEDYGSIRAELERAGQTIGNNDLWIAAHARSTGFTLVTNNEREFRRVPGLAVENWANAA